MISSNQQLLNGQREIGHVNHLSTLQEYCLGHLTLYDLLSFAN